VPPTFTKAETAFRESSVTDQRMMARALELAALGIARVSPGPLVGCVITNAGKVVGEGFYVFNDGKHAETLALEQAGLKARGGTAYVSLEPHAHHGRTPPCTDSLIAAGITRVVAPIEDPNPQVSGKGFEHLRTMGVEVYSGLMAAEASRLNEKYLHFMKTGRPFVHLKLACSLDGKIATRSGESRWITGEQSRARVHQLRNQYDAILVGARTASLDNPLLTDRSGSPRRRPLVRVILDESLQLSGASQLANTASESPVIVFAGANADARKRTALEAKGVEIIVDKSNGRDLVAILEQLGNRSLQSVLVEGGAAIAGKLLDAGLVNKVTFFIAPMIIGGQGAPNAVGGSGVEKISEAFRLNDVEVVKRDEDIEVTGYPAGKG
jgi:diaminohydroxyphosphoribosylaminopyrimidine deaminase/5-amino-6-(5-phosphoribosylamino)uracil reductase